MLRILIFFLLILTFFNVSLFNCLALADPKQDYDAGIATAEPRQIKTGGTHWTSAPKSGVLVDGKLLVGGKTLWIWPEQDEIIKVKRSVTIKFYWRLRPGETFPKEEIWGGLLIQGGFLTAPLKSLDRRAREGVVEYELDARNIEGEGSGVFVVGPVDASGLFVIPQSQPSSNLLTLKVKGVE